MKNKIKDMMLTHQSFAALPAAIRKPPINGLKMKF
jgi:hypothetical protein